MATDNKDNKLLIGSGDYAEILRRAVAVIEHARTEIARHVNGYVSTAYWEIGQMLHERKIESGYGDSVVRKLSEDLKERYPKMGVSPRNLWDMKKFYERFCHSDIKGVSGNLVGISINLCKSIQKELFINDTP